jgi:REP element-mobilizing transposase RayT
VVHEIYLHLTWHTKRSLPLITPALEPRIHDILRERCRETKGVYLHAVDGTPTHVHLAINIEPFVCISDLVDRLKGGCAYDLNHKIHDKVLQWQRGFGVVSFGRKQLAWVVNYVEHQKERHQRRHVHERLERVSLDDDGTPLEDESIEAGVRLA